MDYALRRAQVRAPQRQDILAIYDAQWRDQSYEFRGSCPDTHQGDFSELVSTFCVITPASQPHTCAVCQGPLADDGSCPTALWLRDHKHIETLF
jgi:hypothetical protein